MTNSPTIIIDGYGFVFRAYHVQPSLISTDGTEVGALYGFTAMLIKMLGDFRPEAIAIVFDHGGKNFRHALYQDYKANRPPIDEELRMQLPLVRHAAEALGIKTIEQPGVEADDVIASIVTKLGMEKKHSVIISSDKDLMQLIGEYVVMYDPMKGKYIKESEVMEKFGVQPYKVRDVLALIGDKSDNIPGVPSIGPKTAAELIEQFGSLHELLDNTSLIKQEKRRAVIEEHKNNALLSWELIGLKRELDVNISDLAWSSSSREDFARFIAKYGFKSLAFRAEKLFSSKISQTKEQNISADDMRDIISSTGVIDVCLDNEPVNANKFLPYLVDASVKKITPDLKSLLKFFRMQDDISKFCAIEDLSLMHYAISAGNEQPDLQYWKEDATTKYLELKTQLWKHKALSLYYDIDLPLCKILFEMESNGILVDSRILRDMSHEFAMEISSLEKKIYQLSGVEFNVGSPKQLGDVLFEKMQLPSGKTSAKTQNYSTNVEVLEHLSDLGFEIADHLLKWRELSKLKNTYTDKLPEQINPETGRIHTTFIQNSTSTGRLSSHNPNLQNIPIRSHEGNKIREAFVAKPDHVFISSDYSQIELRILSHIANITPMQEAFASGVDIHKATASHVFGIEEDAVTAEYRRRAKAINFGIIYGISAFGLAKQLSIPKQEAADYIASYFEKYPGIESYMTSTKDFARKHGYVYNIFGRKIYLPTITSANHMMRSFGERAAINAPIQGSAADVTKIAMIEVNKALKSNNLQTKLLLQVHDELILEAPKSELEVVIKLIKPAMENVVSLTTKLLVDVSIGNNWSEL